MLPNPHLGQSPWLSINNSSWISLFNMAELPPLVLILRKQKSAMMTSSAWKSLPQISRRYSVFDVPGQIDQGDAHATLAVDMSPCCEFSYGSIINGMCEVKPRAPVPGSPWESVAKSLRSRRMGKREGQAAATVSHSYIHHIILPSWREKQREKR